MRKGDHFGELAAVGNEQPLFTKMGYVPSVPSFCPQFLVPSFSGFPRFPGFPPRFPHGFAGLGLPCPVEGG